MTDRESQVRMIDWRAFEVVEIESLGVRKEGKREWKKEWKKGGNI